VLAPGLAALGHVVIGVDLPGRGADVGIDCTDPVAVDAVVAETRPVAVVHLAGIPDETSLPDALQSHVVTTGALLEAMVRHGVPRIVYASSNHAVGRTPRTTQVGVDVRGRPDTFYGVGKVAAEALLRLYVDRHGIDAVSTRIGSFGQRPTSRRQLSTWLSPQDTVRMFDAALTAPAPGYAVLYGISNNTRAWWDLEAGRALGYHPEDDAEQFATEIEAVAETEVDRAEAGHVGGSFATSQFERPAFD
jgi:uronate dehydrogenase